MAIQIKQRANSWRIKIVDEEWEMETRKSLDDVLKKILDLKQEYGRLNQ